MPRLIQQLSEQGISDYEFWDGVYKYDSAKQNINAAHRQIVEYAMLAEWPEVAIAEDDVHFFAPGAWDYFVSNKPQDYDLYLSSIYVGDIKEDNTVTDFCGFGLYIVSPRFYKTFLSVNPYEHIDHEMKGKGRFVVSNPFIADQFDGWSSNTGKEEKYGNLLNGRKIFGG